MNKTLDCNIVKDLLPGYIDQLTSEETNRQIEEHLANCQDCRKEYEAMKTPETHVDQTRQINYLKKIRRIVVAVLGLAVLLSAAIVARVYWATTDSPSAYVYDVYEADGQLYVEAMPSDPSMAIRRLVMETQGDNVFLSLSVGQPLPFGNKEAKWSIPQGTKTITLNNMTVYDNGTMVSRQAAMAYANKTPYVGNASDVSELLWQMGVHYEGFELHTEHEPYGMTVYVNRMPSEANAALALACINNLSYVTFNDRAKEASYDLSYFQETYHLDLKSLASTPSGIQKIIDVLE